LKRRHAHWWIEYGYYHETTIRNLLLLRRSEGQFPKVKKFPVDSCFRRVRKKLYFQGLFLINNYFTGLLSCWLSHPRLILLLFTSTVTGLKAGCAILTASCGFLTNIDLNYRQVCIPVMLSVRNITKLYDSRKKGLGSSYRGTLVPITETSCISVAMSIRASIYRHRCISGTTL